MAKLDLKRELKSLYAPSRKVVEDVIVPPMNFLMIDGEGDPNTSTAYRDAVEALFSVSYKVKFGIKRQGGVDYAVMPLEGLWWADDLSVFERREKRSWKWTMMIMQPPMVTGEAIRAGIEVVRKAKVLASLDGLRFESFEEGHCAQMLHIGPFSEEGPTIERIHAHIRSHGELRGKHHEIYLSDIRRAAPEKWKTIIRQPMRKAEAR
jgi:hypothetical protein